MHKVYLIQRKTQYSVQIALLMETRISNVSIRINNIVHYNFQRFIFNGIGKLKLN